MTDDERALAGEKSTNKRRGDCLACIRERHRRRRERIRALKEAK